MSSDKSSERQVSVAVASRYLRELAGVRRAGDSVKTLLNRVVREFPRWSYAKHRMVWYADERAAVSDDDLQALCELCQARNEHRGLLERIERLEAALRVSDEDFHRNQIDALRAARGGSNRAVG